MFLRSFVFSSLLVHQVFGAINEVVKRDLDNKEFIMIGDLPFAGSRELFEDIFGDWFEPTNPGTTGDSKYEKDFEELITSRIDFEQSAIQFIKRKMELQQSVPFKSNENVSAARMHVAKANADEGKVILVKNGAMKIALLLLFWMLYSCFPIVRML